MSDEARREGPRGDRTATRVVVALSVPIVLYMFVTAFLLGGLGIADALFHVDRYNAFVVEMFRVSSAVLPAALVVVADVLGLNASERGRRGFWWAFGGLVAGVALYSALAFAPNLVRAVLT